MSPQTLSNRAALTVVAALGLLLSVAPARAEKMVYVTYADALAHATRPGETLVRLPLELPQPLFEAVKTAADIPLQPKVMRCFQARTAEAVTGYACVDNVIGRKRYITYIIRVEHPAAEVGFVELMTYREKIGANVRFPRFKDQLLGKTLADPLEVNNDIRRIYGATMSCDGLTKGTRRMLMIYDAYFRELPLLSPNGAAGSNGGNMACTECEQQQDDRHDGHTRW